MDAPKTQAEINQEEWSNLDNWSGFWPWTVYFSKRDSRLFVPRSQVWVETPQVWVHSWWSNTSSARVVNLGHRWGFFALNLVFYLIIAFVVWIGWFK
jgi:hypothetical protein